MPATKPKPRHAYEIIGHTIADPAKRRDCTAVFQRVEFSEKTGRIRVEHITRWQGSRCLMWFFDGQTRADALVLLADLRAEGREVLGEPARRSAPIR